MGSQVALTNERTVAGEPVADVTVRGRPTKPLSIGRSEIPGLIDELPLLALLATQLSGTSVIRDAAELRVKETDRIATVAAALTELGAAVEPRPDGFLIRGPTELHGARVSSAGDHRVGMMLAVAGTIAHGETIVDAAESAAVSFPGFAAAFRALGADIDED
jgi:3-phosphoshikimate 1-carboxyvinyltransferase